MNEQQYNELCQAIAKEQMAKMIKTIIRQHFQEPLATKYCQQFDDAKRLADFLEQYSKNLRG